MIARRLVALLLLLGSGWLLLCAAPSIARGQQQQQQAEEVGRLSGRVVEAGLDEMVAVAGATVTVEGNAIAATTDASGAFSLRGVPPGPVALVVRAPSYTTLRVELEPDQRTRPLTLELTWAGEAPEGVTSVAARPRVDTASTTYLGRRDVTAAPVRGAEEILRQVPGLTLVQHGSEGKGQQFFLRGFDASHGADLELTLGGVPLNEWSNVHAQGYLDLALILPELVEGVVVIKGPFALGQGAFATAGSADYRLGVPSADRGWRASYTAGTTGRHRVFASYSPADGHGDSFVGAEATHDDGYGQRRGLDRATLNGRVQLLEDGGHSLHLLVLGSLARFELPGILRDDDVRAGRIGFYDAYDPLSAGFSARGLALISYEQSGEASALQLTGYGGGRQLELLENFTGLLIDPRHGDRRDQRQDTWSFGLFGTYDATLIETLALRVGAGVRGDRFAQREDRIGRELERLAVRRDLRGTQVIAHGLAGLRWHPIADVRLDAGTRADLVHVVADDLAERGAEGGGALAVVSPRATARWRATGSLRLFGAYGRGFRPPEARAFSGFDAGRAGIGEELYGGGEPRITVSDALEVGARWDPATWLGAQLSGFATFIERESVFDHVSGVNLDLRGTRRLGGELVLFSDPLPWLSLRADLTLVDARFTASGNRVPFAPWLAGGVQGVATHGSGLRGGLRLLAVAPRPLPHGATGATLARVDATLGYHWRWLRLDLEVENVLDQRLREGEYHYASHWRPGEPASQLPVLHTAAGPPLNARLTLGVVF